MGQRDYFPLFIRYRESLAGLTDEQLGRVIRAALDYASDGTTTVLHPAESMAFAFIRSDIDRAQKAYEERCEQNRRNIQKRWESGDSDDTGNTSEYERIPEIQANTNGTKQTNKQTINQSNNITREARTRARTHAQGNGGSGGEDGEAFVAPTVEDVRQYCKEAGITLDAERFVTHYESMKWTINGKTLPDWDWKARARKWAKEDAERAAQQPQPMTSFDTDDFFAAALERSYGEPVPIPTKGNG